MDKGTRLNVKRKAMVKDWSQQMSAAVNRETSRNITRKASKMVDKANITQRNASAAIEDSGNDFSHQHQWHQSLILILLSLVIISL